MIIFIAAMEVIFHLGAFPVTICNNSITEDSGGRIVVAKFECPQTVTLNLPVETRLVSLGTASVTSRVRNLLVVRRAF